LLTLAGNVVNPNTQNLHKVYNFYIRVTAVGGSQTILPSAGFPYVLNVGCTSGSTFTEN